MQGEVVYGNINVKFGVSSANVMPQGGISYGVDAPFYSAIQQYVVSGGSEGRHWARKS
jgi:hypothetical protein